MANHFRGEVRGRVERHRPRGRDSDRIEDAPLPVRGRQRAQGERQRILLRRIHPRAFADQRRRLARALPVTVRVDERPTGSHGDREREVGHRQCRGVLHSEAVDGLRARLDRPDIGHTDVDDRRVIDFQHDLAAVVRSIGILGRAGQRCGERDRARLQRCFDIER